MPTRSKGSRGLRRALALSLALAASPALATQVSMPSPAVVIYPGDIIRSGMVTMSPMPATYAQGPFFRDPEGVIGKVAHRTLLPRQPIPIESLSEPKVVVNGAMVRLVFKEGALTISTFASAMQAGSVGEIIPVRNVETGIIISGVVQSDGTVVVSGG